MLPHESLRHLDPKLFVKSWSPFSYWDRFGLPDEPFFIHWRTAGVKWFSIKYLALGLYSRWWAMNNFLVVSALPLIFTRIRKHLLVYVDIVRSWTLLTNLDRSPLRIFFERFKSPNISYLWQLKLSSIMWSMWRGIYRRFEHLSRSSWVGVGSPQSWRSHRHRNFLLTANHLLTFLFFFFDRGKEL